MRIIGDDAQFRAQLEMVEASADTDATVLISGESGTGKELVARLVHDASPRREGPFVAINCAAIPETLIESELFGHVKGAFSGASSAREGKILAANGGTLFLDEIGEMPLAAQAKLLRVLQDRTVTNVGSDVPTPVDVRIVAATNKDLDQLVEQGAFRLDLLYRVNVIHVELPALRERKDDIVSLAEHFIVKTNERTGRTVEGLDDSAVSALLEHNWPGNVRELANVIERAVVLKRSGFLSARDVHIKGKKKVFAPRRLSLVPPPPASEPAPAALPAAAPIETIEDLNLRSALEQVERKVINRALEKTGGNRTEAAALLGLNRTTLIEKMRKLA